MRTNVENDQTAATLAPSASPTGRARRHVAGSACQMSLTADGHPVGWEPCAPIETMLYTAHMPAGAVDAVLTVLREIHDAGYGFRLAGVTSKPPPWDDIDRTLTIGWALGPELKALGQEAEAGLAGVGGTTSIGRHIRSGFALVRADVPYMRGIKRAVMATMRHEIGHAMGLVHANDPRQVMFPVAGPGAAINYGPGDLAGFRALAQSVCTHRRPCPPSRYETGSTGARLRPGALVRQQLSQAREPGWTSPAYAHMHIGPRPEANLRTGPANT